jgi:hypothetical protein
VAEGGKGGEEEVNGPWLDEKLIGDGVEDSWEIWGFWVKDWKLVGLGNWKRLVKKEKTYWGRCFEPRAVAAAIESDRTWPEID